MKTFLAAGLTAAFLISCSGAAFASQKAAVHVTAHGGLSGVSKNKVASHGAGGTHFALGAHGLGDGTPAAAIFGLAAATILQAAQH
jgi:hypothetical protein